MLVEINEVRADLTNINFRPAVNSRWPGAPKTVLLMIHTGPPGNREKAFVKVWNTSIKYKVV